MSTSSGKNDPFKYPVLEWRPFQDCASQPIKLLQQLYAPDGTKGKDGYSIKYNEEVFIWHGESILVHTVFASIISLYLFIFSNSCMESVISSFFLSSRLQWRRWTELILLIRQTFVIFS